jgi:hypothetical protein
VTPEEFEALTVEEVRQRAEAEGPARQGKPEYFDRPWTHLHDELVETQAARIRELPMARRDVFYHSTDAVYGDVFSVLRTTKEEPSPPPSDEVG